VLSLRDVLEVNVVLGYPESGCEATIDEGFDLAELKSSSLAFVASLLEYQVLSGF